jgi:hypothetical protein
MPTSSRARTVLVTAAAAVVFAAAGAERFLQQFQANQACCRIPLVRNTLVTAGELLGFRAYPSELGQDKWVLETMFPGVRHGYFVDVGSGHGTIGSNTKALEARGWRGLCIDPFPVMMHDRTCEVYREVVFSEADRTVAFRLARGLGGIDETLARWNRVAHAAPAVEFRTQTLAGILAQAQAPSFIHFVSLDIEGAELEALKAFPWDRVRVGAFAIEHNHEEPKRADIVALLALHGYRRVHTVRNDDLFAPAAR